MAVYLEIKKRFIYYMTIFQSKPKVVSGIEITRKSWNDVSISTYREIVNIINDEGMDEVSKDVAIISLLCDVDENRIWNLQLPEINALKSQFNWITEFDFPKDKKFKSIKICGEKYDVVVDIDKMSMAQYVDFQAQWKPQDIIKNYAKVLACFIIPKGKKYNDGYDIAEIERMIDDNLSIVTANALCFFFLMRLGILINGTLKFLRWTMKMTNPKEKEKREKLVEQMKQMETMVSKYTIGSV